MVVVVVAAAVVAVLALVVVTAVMVIVQPKSIMRSPAPCSTSRFHLTMRKLLYSHSR